MFQRKKATLIPENFILHRYDAVEILFLCRETCWGSVCGGFLVKSMYSRRKSGTVCFLFWADAY